MIMIIPHDVRDDNRSGGLKKFGEREMVKETFHLTS
jgi:hypothetical protein